MKKKINVAAINNTGSYQQVNSKNNTMLNCTSHGQCLPLALPYFINVNDELWCQCIIVRFKNSTLTAGHWPEIVHEQEADDQILHVHERQLTEQDAPQLGTDASVTQVKWQVLSQTCNLWHLANKNTDIQLTHLCQKNRESLTSPLLMTSVSLQLR